MNLYQIYIILYYIQLNCLNLSQKCDFFEIQNFQNQKIFFKTQIFKMFFYVFRKIFSPVSIQKFPRNTKIKLRTLCDELKDTKTSLPKSTVSRVVGTLFRFLFHQLLRCFKMCGIIFYARVDGVKSQGYRHTKLVE